jgi:hypothetical protein
MATVVIEKIIRKEVTTKYGQRESIGIKPTTETVVDINGDEITLDGRWLNGFRDKAGETDKWVEGMKIKILINTRDYVSKDGKPGQAINFKLPEGVSSIVDEPTHTVDPVDDF